MVAGETPTEIDGEPVLLAAELSSKWRAYRNCTCSLASMAPMMFGVPACLVFAPIYSLCCGKARAEEAESWQLVLTPTTLHFKRKLYACGCCCQSTESKSIPLDKIQDLALVSDCCGDCCGFSDGEGVPWQMRVQTAGSSGGDGNAQSAELVAFCVKDVEAFRRKVLEAKRAMLRGGSSGGAAPKEAAGAAAESAAAGVSSPEAAATLKRMEALMEEALGLMRRSG